MVDKLFSRGEPMALRCFFKNLPMFCPIPVGPLFYQGFYTKDRLDFPLAHGHRSVRPTCLGPSDLVFRFYPLQLAIMKLEEKHIMFQLIFVFGLCCKRVLLKCVCVCFYFYFFGDMVEMMLFQICQCIDVCGGWWNCCLYSHNPAFV